MRDAIVPMAAFAATTKRIKIGSGDQQLDAQRRPDRGYLPNPTISRWTASCIGACGIRWRKTSASTDKPLLAMREHVTVVRDLLR